MKHLKHLVLTVTLILCVTLLFACDSNTNQNTTGETTTVEETTIEETTVEETTEIPYDASEGLAFIPINDGKEYSVVAGYRTESFYEVKIPSTYKGKPVTAIGDKAFYNGMNIVSVEIPDTVTSIGKWAFSGCTSLTNITIPDGVTSVGSSAFSGCTSLESITIPEGVTSIGYETFSWCTSLTSIIIPDSVTYIVSSAFNGCTSLEYTEYNNGKYLGNTSNPYVVLVDVIDNTVTSFDIPDSTKIIYHSAFKDCTSLTNITIPDGVTSVGSSAFSGCTSLESITIPEGVTSIGNYAFSDCSSLESITVEEGNTVYHSSGNCLIETASGTLIVGCKNSVIPTDGSVTSIGDYAFSRCESLTCITIPDSVTSIGGRAFSGCTSLTNITIPDSVTYIGDYAFSGYSSLESITFEGTKEQWNAITKSYCWNDYNDSYTIYCTDGNITKE